MSTFLPISLPSKCLPYDGISEEDINIRAYTAKDEVYLAEINPINLESKYLLVLKEVVKGIDPKLLTLGDRLYIMIWECINSYSPTIKLSTVCSHCLNEVNVSIDLRELKKIELPGNYHQPYTVKLVDKGKDIPLRLLTIKDEIEIEKFEKKHENAHLYRYARSVVSDTDVLNRLEEISKLSARDFAIIRTFHEKFYHGPDLSTSFLCPKCGEEDDISVPFRLAFLYPYGEALTNAFGAGI